MSALYRAIQPRKSTDAPPHRLDVSFRGAKRRGNLAVPGRIIGYFRQKRNCLPEIATGAARPRNDKPLVFTVLTPACTSRQHRAGSGMPLPYNGVCGRRECTEICRCATRRRGRRPLQRTAGSLGKFSIFRLPRAFLSCQIQKSDRLIWVSRSGFYGNTA